MFVLCWGDCFVVFDSLRGPKDIPMGIFRKFLKMHFEKCNLVHTGPQITLKLVQLVN